MIQSDFNIVIFLAGVGGLGGRGVFVVNSAFKSFILKLDMVTSIFSTFLSKIDCYAPMTPYKAF